MLSMCFPEFFKSHGTVCYVPSCPTRVYAGGEVTHLPQNERVREDGESYSVIKKMSSAGINVEFVCLFRQNVGTDYNTENEFSSVERW